jgi:hypothetical protein
MKARVRLTTLLLILGLSACSEPNPLAEKPLDESARLLFSHAAMSATVINGGDTYRQCMEGLHSNKICQTLYQAMSRSFTREGLAISTKQVADKNLYKRLSARLNRLSMLMED